MSNDTVIKVENLSKVFRLYNSPLDRLKESLHPLRKTYHHDFYALDKITFKVGKGETVGVVGRNGSGKSTLLKIICGVLTPSCGSVEIIGRVSALLELGAGFNPDLTGIENIYFNGMLLGVGRQEMDRRIDEILAFADIGEFVYQPVKSYSSGMFVRLAFAVAVCVEPDILIVDEALSVGDMAFQQKCLDRLAKLRENGATILLVTHDIILTRNYCDYVVYLQNGRIALFADAETAGEMYIRDTQKEVQKQVKEVDKIPKESVSDLLETKDGEITRVEVTTAENGPPIFAADDLIIIRIDARVIKKVLFPRIYVQIRDSRGYPLYGIHTLPDELQSVEAHDYLCLSTTFSMRTILAPGEYGVTVAITNAPGDMMISVLDKQVGAATFTVLQKAGVRVFNGAVDLGGVWGKNANPTSGKRTSDQISIRKVGGEHLVIGCVAENVPKYLSQALRLVQSIRWFGGSIAAAKIIVCIVEGVDPTYAEAFSNYAAEVRVVSRFSRKHPQSNKLLFLQQPDIQHYEQVLLLDCDTVIVRDPTIYLHVEGLRAKIADAPTVTSDIFRKLFDSFRLPLPKEEYRCTVTGTATIPYFNAGVLLFSQAAISKLVPRWVEFNHQLVDQFDLLEHCSNFCEQASLTLAVVATGARFELFDNEMNFPIHFDDVIDSMREIDPYIIHYHSCFDSDGYINSSKYPLVNLRINLFNDRLRNEGATSVTQ